jgi:hypothetical protein
MKNTKIIFLLVCSQLIISACATSSSDVDQAVLYEDIQRQYQELDAFECRDSLSEFLAGSTYTTVYLREEKGFNYGTLVINSPIRASVNLIINGYRYRRSISDPREIYFLLTTMQSFLQYEAISTNVTTSYGYYW